MSSLLLNSGSFATAAEEPAPHLVWLLSSRCFQCEARSELSSSLRPWPPSRLRPFQTRLYYVFYSTSQLARWDSSAWRLRDGASRVSLAVEDSLNVLLCGVYWVFSTSLLTEELAPVIELRSGKTTKEREMKPASLWMLSLFLWWDCGNGGSWGSSENPPSWTPSSAVAQWAHKCELVRKQMQILLRQDAWYRK